MDKQTCGATVNGIWYLDKDGKSIGDIIYLKDSQAERRRTPFLIKAVGNSCTSKKGKLYREYFIIQPNRRSSD